VGRDPAPWPAPPPRGLTSLTIGRGERHGRPVRARLRRLGPRPAARREDRPWELPGLTRLFTRLEDEYELSERKVAVDRKLDLISRTVETLVDLLQNKRALRVEWYIVILIVIEIFLTLYQLFAAR
jgi:hypothetical protein